MKPATLAMASLAMAILALTCLAVPLPPTLVAAAEPVPRSAQQARAPDASMPDAHTLACFLLNSMTRAAPERARRETLLRAALSSGCLAMPAASPFRGDAQRQARAGARQGVPPRPPRLADLETRKARHAADPLFRRCLLWAFTGYPSGLDETYCTGTFHLLPSGFALTCETYLKSGFPTPLDRKACQLFWRERLQ